MPSQPIQQYCVTQTHHSQARLIAVWCADSPRHYHSQSKFWCTDDSPQHISFSVKADRAFLVRWYLQYCVSQRHILCQGWSHIYGVLIHLDTYHSQSRLIAHFWFADLPIQYCVSQTHIILCQGPGCQGWSHIYGVLIHLDTYHSQSRLIAHFWFADLPIQYCVSQTHIILCQGWSHIYGVLIHLDTYHSQSRLIAHFWFADLPIQYCVSQTHIILQILCQGWSHIYVVLIHLDTYHSQSRLIAHIVFHRHISFSVKADSTFMVCWFT